MLVSAIIPVAGQGKRFGGQVPKQYIELNGLPVIKRTLEKFVSLPAITSGVVVAAADEIERISSFLTSLNGFSEKFRVISGGKERQDSVYLGLQQIPSDTDIVVVHDGVRPLVSKTVVLKSIEVADESGACIVAVPVKETIKSVEGEKVIQTLPRDNLWQAQTPQTFRYALLKNAHEKAHRLKYYSTDESALVEWAGHAVSIVRGDYSNIKITTEEDLKLASVLLNESKD